MWAELTSNADSIQSFDRHPKRRGGTVGKASSLLTESGAHSAFAQTFYSSGLVAGSRDVEEADMARIEIRLMEAAIAVAEELNFSRAAHRLHVTQPAITKQIAELENRLGFCLFERDHQTVTVNDAGRAYVEEARLAVMHGERAAQAARDALSNAEIVLHIGKSPYTDPFLISMLLSVRLPLFPRLKLEITSSFSRDLIHELLEGRLDLALITEPPASPQLSMAKVGEEPFYLAFAEQSDLAHSQALTLEQLHNKTWILFGRGVHHSLYDSILRLAEQKAVRPHDIQHILIPEEAFQFITEWRGVAFLTKIGALRIARDGITLRPLVEQQLTLRTYLAARADNESKVASEMARAFGRKIKAIEEDAQLILPMLA
jgi:DNA-binding transcriptional LysR family regulator